MKRNKVQLVNCELPLNTWIMLLEDKGLGDYLKVDWDTKKLTKGKPIRRIGYITINQLKLSPPPQAKGERCC